LQRKAAEAIHAAEREERTVKRSAREATKRRMPVRVYRATRKKHPVLACGAFIIAGTGWALGKGAKWTTIYTVRSSRWGSRRLYQHARRQVTQRKWIPAGSPISGKTPRGTTIICYACDKSFRTAEMLNIHMQGHRKESRTPAPKPTIHRSVTSKTAGRTIVRPVTTGGSGRHRARHHLPNAQRVNALVAAHQSNLSKIGERAMTNSPAIRKLTVAAKGYGDQPRPRTLGDFRATFAGIEKFTSVMNDALDDYMRTLVNQSKVDPTILRPYINAMQEAFGVAGLNGNRIVAAFEDYYQWHIKVKKNEKVPPPDIDLGKTG
jgi:hypothetical protein